MLGVIDTFLSQREKLKKFVFLVWPLWTSLNLFIPWWVDNRDTTSLTFPGPAVFRAAQSPAGRRHGIGGPAVCGCEAGGQVLRLTSDGSFRKNSFLFPLIT